MSAAKRLPFFNNRTENVFFSFGITEPILRGLGEGCVPLQTTMVLVSFIFEPAHDKAYNKTCATSEDSDQPAHPRRLMRVFTDRMCLLQPPGYPKRDKRESLPYWLDVQADLSIFWSHSSYYRFCRALAHFVWFCGCSLQVIFAFVVLLPGHLCFNIFWLTEICLISKYQISFVFKWNSHHNNRCDTLQVWPPLKVQLHTTIKFHT